MSDLLKWLNSAFGIKPKRGAPARRANPAPAKVVPAKARPSLPGQPSFHWTDGGNFDFEVVGESFYQDNLRAIAGQHGDNFVDKGCVAILTPDDANKHDNKAVAVYINGLQVGHLSSDDARSFRRRLSSKKLTGQSTSTDAVIRGGGLGANGRYFYGVQLDMKPFE